MGVQEQHYLSLLPEPYSLGAELLAVPLVPYTPTTTGHHIRLPAALESELLFCLSRLSEIPPSGFLSIGIPRYPQGSVMQNGI